MSLILEPCGTKALIQVDLDHNLNDFVLIPIMHMLLRVDSMVPFIRSPFTPTSMDTPVLLLYLQLTSFFTIQLVGACGPIGIGSNNDRAKI